MNRSSVEPLEDLLDSIRDIDGFPIGKDEDILALSDPPFYTACPNPHIKQFVEEYGKPVDIKKKENYHRFKEMIAEQLNQESKGAFGPRRGISERYGKTIVVESKENKND